MWPFDTIKRLTQQRDEAYAALAETKAALGAVAERCGEKNDTINQLRQTLSQNDVAMARLRFRADELAAQLAEAQKNDARGPKGRYAKKEPKTDV